MLVVISDNWRTEVAGPDRLASGDDTAWDTREFLQTLRLLAAGCSNVCASGQTTMSPTSARPSAVATRFSGSPSRKYSHRSLAPISTPAISPALTPECTFR